MASSKSCVHTECGLISRMSGLSIRLRCIRLNGHDIIRVGRNTCHTLSRRFRGSGVFISSTEILTLYHCSSADILTLYHCSSTKILTLYHYSSTNILILYHCSGTEILTLYHCSGTEILTLYHCSGTEILMFWYRDTYTLPLFWYRDTYTLPLFWYRDTYTLPLFWLLDPWPGVPPSLSSNLLAPRLDWEWGWWEGWRGWARFTVSCVASLSSYDSSRPASKSNWGGAEYLRRGRQLSNLENMHLAAFRNVLK